MSIPITARRTYLGDGAYAEYDGYSITITTSNGIRDTNTVVLEPEVLAEFLRFVTTLHNTLNKKEG